MKKYIKPNIRSIGVESCNILVSSNKADICDEYCKLWHICRDRDKNKGKMCNDFKMKEL